MNGNGGETIGKVLVVDLEWDAQRSAGCSPTGTKRGKNHETDSKGVFHEASTRFFTVLC